MIINRCNQVNQSFAGWRTVAADAITTTKGNIMKKSAILLALALGVSAMTVMAQDQGGTPPAGDRPPGADGGQGGPGRMGGPGGERGQGGFHLLPPRAKEVLNLTAEQEKDLAALEAETKAKLEKILTPEQMTKLKQMRPPQRGGQGGRGGRGGQGGPGGGPGGPGGDQGGPGGMGGPGGPGGDNQPPTQPPTQ